MADGRPRSGGFETARLGVFMQTKPRNHATAFGGWRVNRFSSLRLAGVGGRLHSCACMHLFVSSHPPLFIFNHGARMHPTRQHIVSSSRSLLTCDQAPVTSPSRAHCSPVTKHPPRHIHALAAPLRPNHAPGKERRRVRIPSRFTHDAVRGGALGMRTIDLGFATRPWVCD